MSEEKKKDALADALNALAAGDPVEEQPLSGHAQDEHVTLSPAVPPKPVAPQPPAPRATTPARSAAPPAQPPAPGTQPRQTAPAPPAKGPTLKASGVAPARPPNAGTPVTTPRPPQRTLAPAPGARPPLTPAARPAAPRPAPPAGSAGRPAAPPPPQVVPAAPKPSARTFVPPRISPPASTGGQATRPPAPGASPRAVAPAKPPAAKPPVPPQPPAPAGEAFVVRDDTAEPSGHHLSDHGAEVAAEAEAIAHVVDDDDTLNLPAPGPEAFAPRQAPPRPKRQSVARTVEFKQTIIPVLLTQGVLLPAIAAYLLALGEESPLVGHAWIPLTLLGIGLLMLLFAGLTMLQVRHQLAQAAAA